MVHKKNLGLSTVKRALLWSRLFIVYIQKYILTFCYTEAVPLEYKWGTDQI